MIWLHSYHPQVILLDLGIIKIYWYGFLVTLTILLSAYFIFRLIKGKEEQKYLWNLFFYLIIFGLIGARIYHVIFYNLQYFLENPLDILKIWQGGMAIHGAILAGIIVTFFYTKKHRLLFWQYSDYLALVLPLGQAIGRWGNYFNQELFGKPCNYSWCIPIDKINRPLVYQQNQYFHPVFLYESLLNLLLFIILLFGFKSKRWPQGMITSVYLISYSIIRFFTEFLRLDSETIFLSLKPVQWLCLVIIIIVLISQKFMYKNREIV
ncbi:prolipoprotein diacylglyceryl transferase [Patescibacteria group bacterium]|nr:prolipoprotein diacylglyceryl transferase [Patescibacteria group bacterium]